MRSAAVIATNVEFDYGKGFSLSVPSLTVRSGAVTCLVGPSGAGKTTLMKLLALLEKPRSGTIQIGSEDPTQDRPRVAMVLQGAPMWRGTVEDNIRLALTFADVPQADRDPRIEMALSLVDLPEHRTTAVVKLSGGQAQRVALARAIAVQPKIVLLDEPLAHIDEPSREGLAVALKRHLLSSGAAVLWVTHDRGEALSIGDDLAVIEDGALLQQGTPKELIERPNSERVARFLGTDNILRGIVSSSESGIASVEAPNGAVMSVVSDLPIGTPAIVMVRSEDVGLWLHEPADGSPRNRYSASIEEIFQMGATVKLVTGGGPDLRVLLTRPTFQQFGLAKGDRVWVGFKASSAQVLRAVE